MSAVIRAMARQTPDLHSSSDIPEADSGLVKPKVPFPIDWSGGCAIELRNSSVAHQIVCRKTVALPRNTRAFTETNLPDAMEAYEEPHRGEADPGIVKVEKARTANCRVWQV